MASIRQCLCLVLTLLSCVLTTIAVGPDSLGTEFVLGFTDNTVYPNTQPNDMQILITTPLDEPAFVTVTLPLYQPNWSQEVKVSKLNPVTVSIPYQMRADTLGKSNKAVHITSDRDINVHAVNQEMYSVDAMLVFPTDVLCTSYFALTYTGQAQLLVVAVQDDTDVSLTFPANTDFVYQGVKYGEGDTLTFTLNQHETFSVFQLDDQADFTGTRITSSEPVAVFSGNKNVAVSPGPTPTSDHLSEMMRCVETWGKEFLLPRTPERTVGDVFRLLASQDATTLTFPDGSTHVLSSAGDFMEFDKPSDKLDAIRADKPIQVAMFSKTYQDDGPDHSGDPSMMLIPPVPQFETQYQWETLTNPDGSPFKNQVVVLVPENKLRGVVLDGVTNPSWSEVLNVSGLDWVYAWTGVDPGRHWVSHVNPTVSLLVLATGLSTDTSYAFPAAALAARLNTECTVFLMAPGDKIDNDCDGLIDEELNNLYDDDGDGLIDEDLAHWTDDHICTVTGDPHARTFSGQRYNLPFPCAYAMAHLTLSNAMKMDGFPFYETIHVSIIVGNNKTTAGGQYYAGSVSVNITLANGTNMGPSEIIRTNEQLVLSERVWETDLTDNVQGRLDLRYNKNTNLAELSILGTSLWLRFRPAFRHRRNLHRSLPGVYLTVGNDMIHDERVRFPHTVCSTVNDRGNSLLDHLGRPSFVQRANVGIYVVLNNMKYNIPTGDQDELCPSVMGKFELCSNQTFAFRTCFHWLVNPGVIRCLEHSNGATAMTAVNQCLDYACSEERQGCDQFKAYTKTCSKMQDYVVDFEC